MVILYKIPLFTYLVARFLIRVPYIGLVNIVMGRELVPELVGVKIDKDALLEKVRDISERRENSRIRVELEELRRRLGERGAVRRAAEIIWKNL